MTPESKFRYEQPREEADAEWDKFDINPLFYAHISILQILKSPNLAFINGMTEAGLHSLVISVDQLERICRANNMKIDEVALDAAKIEVEKEYGTETGTLKQAKLANAKFQIMLKAVFAKSRKKVDVLV